MKLKIFATLIVFWSISHVSIAQIQSSGFTIIPMGVKGGLDESNLSAYLVAAKDSNQFICLDAGTIHSGLKKAINNNLFKEKDANELQKKIINSYFISHGHLDHTAGLVLNSPNDSKKNIYAIPSVIEVFKKSLFSTWSWSNFGSEGDQPVIGKYKYQYLVPQQEISIEPTGLHLTPFVLSHVKPYESTAFLIRNNTTHLLYLGDTGPDAVEQSDKLFQLWNHIAPLVKEGQLKAIFIEVSFTNGVADKFLFGHLTPNWLMREMEALYDLSGSSLKKVPIYITHIKPCSNCEFTIKKEVQEGNSLGLNFQFVEQGKQISLF